jgi:hypothetical protein
MARHAGSSTRLRYLGTAAAACSAAAVALLALPWATGTAAAQSAGAAMTMTGVRTSQAPGGTNTVDITAGDSVVFSVGPPPSRAEAPLLGYYIVLNAGSLPSHNSSVKLSGSNTYSVDFPSEGSYSFSWSGYNSLGRISPRTGEYTSATVVVAPVPAPPGGGGGGDTTPPDTSASTPPASGTGTGTPTVPPGSSVPAPGLPGIPGVPGTGGGFIITTNAQGLPVSVPTFGGPGHDPGLGTAAGVVGLQGTPGAPIDGGGGGNAGALAGNANADQQFVADPHAAHPPRALAILSITSLAGVVGSYAWLFLGRHAARAAGKR